MARKYASRIFITIIGTLLVITGIIWGMLGVLGEKSTGTITDVRREQGEFDNSKSGKYSYSIGYSFELPNGDIVNGATKEISDGVYLKHPNTAVTVRYLKAFPQINTLDKNAGFDIGKIVMIAIGGFIVIIVNKY